MAKYIYIYSREQIYYRYRPKSLLRIPFCFTWSPCLWPSNCTRSSHVSSPLFFLSAISASHSSILWYFPVGFLVSLSLFVSVLDDDGDGAVLLLLLLLLLLLFACWSNSLVTRLIHSVLLSPGNCWKSEYKMEEEVSGYVLDGKTVDDIGDKDFVVDVVVARKADVCWL